MLRNSRVFPNSHSLSGNKFYTFRESIKISGILANLYFRSLDKKLIIEACSSHPRLYRLVNTEKKNDNY